MGDGEQAGWWWKAVRLRSEELIAVIAHNRQMNGRRDELDADTAAFHALLAGTDVAMLVTLDHAGKACSHPTRVLTSPDQAALWIIAPRSAPFLRDVQACADVVLHITPDGGGFAAIIGRAHVHHDRPSALGCDSGLTGRVDADDTALIHVIVDSVEAWTTPSSTPHTLQFVKPVGRARRLAEVN